MKELFPTRRDHHWLVSAREVLVHACITMLAIAIALSLPIVAQYILYEWWPKVSEDANVLVATELAFAAALVLLFNISRIAWEDRHKVRVAELAALVYARQRYNWLTRWRERRLVRRLPAARDAFILTLTGFDTFAGEKSLLSESLKSAYEIRVMLLDPSARSAEQRVNSLPRGVTLQSFGREIEASITYLDWLRTLGKKVTLKFYEQEPFWKVAVLGDHVWVQYCHRGFEVKNEPEYVFALNPDSPRQGFFVPFYMHFLEQWSDPRHPEYDFDTRELVYRDRLGKEVRRTAFDARDGRDHPALLAAKKTACRQPRTLPGEVYAVSH
ncbi:MAG: hypothetical protein HY526_04860 [Betaproteobacteria bacterium]|nr:hypothetical protein [Betaproteobacteria bacterium]